MQITKDPGSGETIIHIPMDEYRELMERFGDSLTTETLEDAWMRLTPRPFEKRIRTPEEIIDEAMREAGHGKQH